MFAYWLTPFVVGRLTGKMYSKHYSIVRLISNVSSQILLCRPCLSTRLFNFPSLENLRISLMSSSRRGEQRSLLRTFGVSLCKAADIVHSHSLLYFVVVSAANLLEMAFYLQPVAEMQGVCAFLAIALSSLMCCR